MRVLALVTLPTIGAGGRLRVEQYRPFLARAGIELTVSHFFDDATHAILYQHGHTLSKALGTLRGIVRRVRDLIQVRRFDLVLIYREAIPIGPAFFERVLGRLGVPYVYDFDDAIFIEASGTVNHHWAWLRPVSRVAETTRRATCVIVGNEYLAEWARQHNPNVVILTTPVDTDRHQPSTETRAGAPVIVGWVGSHSTAPYLHLVDRPLAEIASRRSVIVRVIGGSYEAPGVPVEQIPYTLASEALEVATFDIGILPEPDDPWTRGKGAFKALVYMSSAVPVVASAVGVNAQVIADEVGGLLASTNEEWIAALDRLAGDPELRQRLGRAGRRRAEAMYSLEVLAPRFEDILKRALVLRPWRPSARRPPGRE
jgi:glycosyltransferase involved in cell wall biosynthesis